MTRGNWTPERISLLKRLWDDGRSLKEIGAELAISRNAVVGKVHRLELPGRPSPLSMNRNPTPGHCIWPIFFEGKRGKTRLRWCSKKVQFGKDFCFDHQAEAYTRRRLGEPLPMTPAEYKKQYEEEQQPEHIIKVKINIKK